MNLPPTTIVFVVIGLAVPTYTFDGCIFTFGRRGCSDRIHEGVLVTCEGSSHEAYIPDNIPSDTVLISLVNFELNHLQKANFTRFRALECLNLFDSNIARVDDNTFEDNTALHELNLRGTQLDSGSLNFLSDVSFTPVQLSITNSKSITQLKFPAHPGSPLERIESFRLNNNNIDHIHASILRRLDAVHTLSFSNNKLTELNWHLLRKIDGLNELFLDNNNIQTIPGDEASTIFYTVNELTLRNNPLHCNCKLLWLKEFYDISAGKRLDKDQVQCLTPTRVLMKDIDPSTMLCNQPTAPTFNWLELDDGRVAVNCSATGDPAPTLTMMFPDGQTMITPPGKDLSQLKTSTHYVLTSPGPMTCIASNTEGATEYTENSPGWGQYCSYIFGIRLENFKNGTIIMLRVLLSSNVKEVL